MYVRLHIVSIKTNDHASLRAHTARRRFAAKRDKMKNMRGKSTDEEEEEEDEEDAEDEGNPSSINSIIVNN